MPHSRAVSIVLCSCGKRWGNYARAALHEDLAAVEQGLIASYIDLMVRHFELGHRLSLGENAPREFLGVVAEAARRVAAARDARPCTGAEFVAAAQLAIEPRSDDEIREIIDDLESR